MADPIRQALYDLLTDDAPLMAKATAVYYRQADEAEPVTYPIVIYDKMSGTPEWTFRESIDWDIWVVKGVGDASDAEEIADLLVDLLDDAQLAIAGREHYYLRRYSDVSYAENQDGQRYEHVGYMWRLATGRTP